MKQAFVDRIAELHSLAPHFHLSMQSGSDRILSLMKRKYNAKQALDGIERLRRAIPGAQFTTDMIVGFPNETEEDFLQSIEFAKQAGFLMIHVFPYSKRKGTPAATMSGQIPEEIKHERVKLLSQTAQEIRQEILDGMTGQTVTLLTETYEDGVARGHTDSFVEVAFPTEHFGHAEVVNVRILGNNGTLCHGERIQPMKGEA
jgi:threonylcarbamoyladenosine tRNA methylthiotransferase MtaB